jgi:hypothetical protein
MSVVILFERPICKYLTLHQRGKYEICPVCGWEDEGDEAYKDPSASTDGPNGNMSLDEARKNFKSQKPNIGKYRRIVDLAQDELDDFLRELENGADNDLSSIKARKQLLEHIITEQMRRS